MRTSSVTPPFLHRLRAASSALCRQRLFDRSKPEILPRKFVLEIRTTEFGKKKLYFPFMSISDLHLGTRHSRAKRTAHMLENTKVDSLKAVGDIVDILYMLQKSTWNFATWHRQVLGHLLRKNANVFSGNHDPFARGETIIDKTGQQHSHRSWLGRKIYGLSFVNEETYTDPKGRRIHIEHGDSFDDKAFGEKKGFWYKIGDFLHTYLADLDTSIQHLPKMDGFSIAAKTKRVVKTFINKGLGVDRAISEITDRNPHADGLLYGHSHMGGIRKTPNGKIILNDGCSTDHVQAMVHDQHGTFAFITWHRDRLDIEEENGAVYTVSFKDIGLQCFDKDPTQFNDIYAKQADRLIRFIYRLAPPVNRQKLVKERRRSVVAHKPPRPFPADIHPPQHPFRYEQAERRKKRTLQPTPVLQS